MRPDKSLNRRTLLRGFGTAVALPLLDAMFPAFTSAAKSATAAAPSRMAFLYVPNGIVMDQWIPTGAPGVTALPAEWPRVSAALAPFRDDVMILGGLTQNGGRALGDGPGDHGRAGASYLTCVHPKKTNGRDLQVGLSVDQIAAQRLQGKTRFASLELGCEEGVQGGSCDNGYSCAYSNSISWRTPSSPNPAEIRPRAVFERLFGPGDLDPDPARRLRQQKYQQSILDVVTGDARRLSSTLGGGDKRKLDEYLSSIRDVEQRIQNAERNRASTSVKPPAMAPPEASIPTDFGEHARIMMDLTTLAFQTDATRVVTLLLALEQSPRAYPEIGIPEAHHGLTHHQGDKEKIAKVTAINCYQIIQFAYLLEKLKSTPDGDGTLLDHSMITYGSGLSDGNAHDHGNLPLVLAGRGNGKLRPGRHIRYPDETPMANLFVTMLDKMDVPVEHLGDSNGELEHLSGI
ncbi:MAG: DUF1552 domain-containing protein [Acidobacteriota bacterium]|nr:DUF1552 domain-containing protein [Acidobacteriota bacterium]